ncbi:uncharacterized protein [Haliotis cracherodii]|uniref:uncharacterized protein n=1 Tax=Haliotis cracherodii TaxID=6455 RepID=UPI0039E79745
MDCRHTSRVFFFVLQIAGYIVSVRSGFIYFHHYLLYERAYEVCRGHNLRLLRVDSEAKRQQVMQFTEGVKDFTVFSNKFFISLRYNESTTTHLWPDGTANTLTTNWEAGQPKLPDQCVVQYSGQSPKHGQWKSVDCETSSPFVCESGHPNDPDLGIVLTHHITFGSFLKTDSAMLNTYDPVEAAEMSYFRHEISDLVIYKGFKEDPVEVCALRCKDDNICLGIIYTNNLSPHSYFDFCIFLQN